MEEYKSTIINQDEDSGRDYWIYIDIKKATELFGEPPFELNAEKLELLKPETCYLDSVNSWSQGAVDKLDHHFSVIGGYNFNDVDRVILESVLLGRHDK